MASFQLPSIRRVSGFGPVGLWAFGFRCFPDLIGIGQTLPVGVADRKRRAPTIFDLTRVVPKIDLRHTFPTFRAPRSVLRSSLAGRRPSRAEPACPRLARLVRTDRAARQIPGIFQKGRQAWPGSTRDRKRTRL